MVFGYELIVIVLVAIIGKGILNFEYGIVLFLCTAISLSLLDLAIISVLYKKEKKDWQMGLVSDRPIPLRPKNKNPKRKKFLIRQGIWWILLISIELIAYQISFACVKIALCLSPLFMWLSLMDWARLVVFDDEPIDLNVENGWLYLSVLPIFFFSRFAIWMVETLLIVFRHL